MVPVCNVDCLSIDGFGKFKMTTKQVMDLERRNAAFSYIFKQCHTDLNVVRHCAPSGKIEIDNNIIHSSEMMTPDLFQGLLFL